MSQDTAWEKKWIIWNHERNKWWGPNKCGYVIERVQAGRYTYPQACEICADANTATAHNCPCETMVEDWGESPVFIGPTEVDLLKNRSTVNTAVTGTYTGGFIYAPYIPLYTQEEIGDKLTPIEGSDYPEL